MSKCDKCAHCIWSKQYSTGVMCEVFGEVNDMCVCRAFITQKEKKRYEQLKAKVEIDEEAKA